METETLEKIDIFLKDISSGKVRPDHVKLPAMRKLLANLDKYQENFLDMILTIRAMKTALRREIVKLER